MLWDDVGADDVGRHQVGRELDSGKGQVEGMPERAQEHRLAKAGYALEQDMAARDQGYHGVAQEVFLADDQARQLGFEIVRELRYLLWVCARLFRDHEPAGHSPNRAKYSRTRPPSLPRMTPWLVAPSAASCYHCI